MSEVTRVNSELQDENRYFPRWATKNRAIVHFEGDLTAYPATTEDLSCAGACVTLKPKVEPKQKISLKVYLTDRSAVDLNAEVMWVKPDNDQYQAGLSFFETPATTQEKILDHAFSINKEKFIRQIFNGWENY